MLKKIKDWVGSNLDVYKVENASDVGSGLVRHIWKGEETATQIGTTLTANIMNTMQEGLVHSIEATRTIGDKKDIYTANLKGLDEFGIFKGLKLLIKVDSKNQNENIVINLNNTEYELKIINNGVEVNLPIGSIKENTEYLIEYNGTHFIVLNTGVYGTINGTSLEGSRMAELMGTEYGGLLSKTGTKKVGVAYYDEQNKQMVVPTEENDLNFFDLNKFIKISDYQIAKEVNELSRKETKEILVGNGRFVFSKVGKVVTAFVHLQNYQVPMVITDNAPAVIYPVGFEPSSMYFNFENALATKEANNLNGETRLILRNDKIVYWGVNNKSFYEIKGSITYCTD